MQNWLASLLLGVAASLLAGILLIGLAGLFSKGARWVLTGILGRLLDVDVDMVFSNPREAAEDITKELTRSSSITLFTGRGSELQRETFERLFVSSPRSPSRRVRILLPSIRVDSPSVDWVSRREQENSRFDSAFGEGLLSLQIEATVKFLKRYAAERILEVKCYNLPLIGRVLITDRFAYLTPYSAGTHSRNSRVLKFRRGGDMFAFLQRIVDEAWETGRSPWEEES